ncbi:MAG: transcriptional regulator [Actinomycetia bacterium]|nr:transcriptional regulator [Actinomycetes bacterium]
MTARDRLLARTFVDVADTLVTEFDVVDFLTTLANRCVELFDASEAGLMLAGRNGGLQVAASSSRSMNNLELFEIQHAEGPCVECYHSGSAVFSNDVRAELDRWPAFGPEALRAGYKSVVALPMRLRDTTIGSLNLLREQPGGLSEDDVVVAQSLADVATIGLLQHRAAGDSQLLTEQLQYALNSRVVIEQAKGVIAESANLTMEGAFGALRQYARNHNQRLSDVARAVSIRTLAPADVIGGQASRPR